MKPNTGITLLGATLAIVTGMFGAQASGLFDDTTNNDVLTKNAGLIMGHVTMYTTDGETGAIKEYRQSDNLIVHNGENCAAKLLFRGSGAGNSVCTGANTVGFNYIAIGESSTAPADAQNRLVDPADETGLATPLQGNIVWTNATGTAGAIAEITAQFTNTGASETITESGLFNGTSATTSGMFARQIFTGIPVATSDSLTVEWTVAVGGGSVP